MSLRGRERVGLGCSGGDQGAVVLTLDDAPVLAAACALSPRSPAGRGMFFWQRSGVTSRFFPLSGTVDNRVRGD